MTEPHSRSGSGTLTILGAGALMVLCCAGPVLIAGGVLSGLGSALRNPWLIALGALVIAGATGYAIAHFTHRRHAGAETCCPPDHRSAFTADTAVDKPNGP